MIEFKPVTLNMKETYEQLFQNASEHGCEYSFTNLFTWGNQTVAFQDDHILLFSQFDDRTFYPFPIGTGDKKGVIESIRRDAAKRGITCRLTGLSAEDKHTLETLFPGEFYYLADRDNYDYVYNIHDLADLKGRKLHRKRNHLKHFQKTHPNCVIEAVSPQNIDTIRSFLTGWYALKQSENPDNDYHNEQKALDHALKYHQELGMEGLLLKENDEILAFTLGSRMTADTFDVHYEKAFGDVDGAYTTINQAFANHIRNAHPDILYLNREEDMGIPGLRKAKQSYFPHHLIQKYVAIPLLHSYTFQEPDARMLPSLRDLWKEAFGDCDAFLDAFFHTAYAPTRCRIGVFQNRPICALYWFDCTLNDQKIAYIYAVATVKDARGTGACHSLLADTHQHLKELGYDGVLLVPGSEKLVHFYEGCEYEPCTKISVLDTEATDMDLTLEEISKETYAALRPDFLPKNSVLQENESLDFLSTQAKFYRGESFLLCACIQGQHLYGIEFLGDSELCSGVTAAHGCTSGTFRTPGKEKHFSMFHPLHAEAETPQYFAFAFDL